MFVQHSFASIFEPHHQQQQQKPFEQAFAPATNAIPQYGMPVRFNPMIGFALAGLFAACFFAGSICVYLKRFCAVRRSHTLTNHFPILVVASVPPMAAEGLDKDSIRSLPIIAFSTEMFSKQGKSQTECSVCLTEFHRDEALKFLPGCSHLFHPDCIDMWLHSHATCPVCRCLLIPSKCRFLDVQEENFPRPPVSTSGDVSILIPDEDHSAGLEDAYDRLSELFPEKDDSLTITIPKMYLDRSYSSPMLSEDGEKDQGGDHSSGDEALTHLRRVASSV